MSTTALRRGFQTATTLANNVKVVTKGNQRKLDHRYVKQQQKEGGASFWAMIGGFSRYASRSDLDAKLGELRPISVDATLDNALLPDGKWVLNILDSDREVFKNWRTRVEKKNSIDELTLKSLTVNIRTMASNNITNCTVRVKVMGGGSTVQQDQIFLFFEGYKLADMKPNDVVWKPDHNESTYLVNFATPEEAQRAMAEKGFKYIEKQELKLVRYQQ
jgi:hypothetical protein